MNIICLIIIFFSFSLYAGEKPQKESVDNACIQQEANLYQHVTILLQREESLKIAEEEHEKVFEEYNQCMSENNEASSNDQ